MLKNISAPPAGRGRSLMPASPNNKATATASILRYPAKRIARPAHQLSKIKPETYARAEFIHVENKLPGRLPLAEIRG